MNDTTRKKHEPLNSEAAAKLGEIHRILIEASDELRAKSERREPGKFLLTEFGEEIGGDEIHWWVFKKEPDLDELRNRTEFTLNAVQRLRELSKVLPSDPPDSYERLISLLEEFALGHQPEIECLHEYVTWLRNRDPLAPTILFTYRVWGSSRRGDRWVSWHSDNPPELAVDQLRYIEVVFGLFRFISYTIDHVRMEIGSEVYDSLDPEDPASDELFHIPEERVLLRTS